MDIFHRVMPQLLRYEKLAMDTLPVATQLLEP